MCMLSHTDDLLRTFLLRYKGTIITVGDLCFELPDRLLMEVMKMRFGHRRNIPIWIQGLIVIIGIAVISALFIYEKVEEERMEQHVLQMGKEDRKNLFRLMRIPLMCYKIMGLLLTYRSRESLF